MFGTTEKPNSLKLVSVLIRDEEEDNGMRPYLIPGFQAFRRQ